MDGFPVAKVDAFTHVALECLFEHGENTPHTLPLFQSSLRSSDPGRVPGIEAGRHRSAAWPLRSACVFTEEHGRETLQGAILPSIRGRWPVPRGERDRVCPTTMFAELERIVAAGTIIALGRKRRMFDPEAIAFSLDSILFSLKELPLRGIVLAGPFSAPDPITRFFRRMAVPISEAAAKKHACTFVDVCSLLESYPKGKNFNANFADPLHLSVLGHQRVGVLVGAALKRVMEHSTATEDEPVMAAPIKEVARAAGPRGWAGLWLRCAHKSPRIVRGKIPCGRREGEPGASSRG